MNLCRVRHISRGSMNRDGVTDAQTKVASHGLVHQYMVILGIGSSVRQSYAQSLLSLLACQIGSVDQSVILG